MKLKFNWPIIFGGMVLVFAIGPVVNWVTVARLSRNLAVSQSSSEEYEALLSIRLRQNGYRVRFFDASGMEIHLRDITKGDEAGDETGGAQWSDIAEVEIAFKTGKVIRRRLLSWGNVGILLERIL